MRFDWRVYVARALRLWRGSLQLRTVTLTVVLSTLAVTVVGGYIVTSVRANLFDQNREQIVAQGGRAIAAAQREFTRADETGVQDDLEIVQGEAFAAVRAVISSEPGVGMLRVPGQSGASLLTLTSGPFVQDMASPELRAAVVEAEADVVSWQSIGIDDDGAVDPGIIVGSLLRLPQGQLYELYIVYNLEAVQETLDFMQGTLALAGFALVLLIGAVAYLVVRLVVGPVRVAAEASEKLAAGELESRLPEGGDDELSTLARSFNRMADSLQRQIRQLADLSRVQQRFVSDVSHELRTPLTTIRLAGDVLYDQRDGFPPATARTAELLHAQTQRFETLLADLLEMSRYDAGAVQLESTRGGSAGFCRTFWETPSTTASRSRSTSTSTATSPPSRSPCATTASGWPPPISSTSSTASGGPTRRASDRPGAPGSGSRSPSRMPRCMAGCSRCGRNPGRAAASG
jgi:two-component system sensor histidine kinase MtrB